MSKMFICAVLFFAIRVSCLNQPGQAAPNLQPVIYIQSTQSDHSLTGNTNPVQESANTRHLPRAELFSVLQHPQKSNQIPDYNQHLYQPAYLSRLVSSVAEHPSVMHPPPFLPTFWIQQPTHAFDQQSLPVHPNLQFPQPSYLSQAIHHQYPHHPQVVYSLPLSLQSIYDPHSYLGGNQPAHPAPTVQNLSPSSHGVNQTLQPSQITHQIIYLSEGSYQPSHSSKVMTYFLYPSQGYYHLPPSNFMAPSLVWGQRPAYEALQIPDGPGKNVNGSNQHFNLSEPEISKTRAVLNDSAVGDSLPSASSDQGLNFPVTVQEAKPQLSRPASVERQNQTPTAASNAISVANLRFNASDSAKHTVGVSSTGSTLLSLIRSNQSTSGGTTQPTVEASSAWSRQSSHLGSNLLSLIGSSQSSSPGSNQSSSPGSSQSSSGGTAKVSSAGSRQSSHLESNLLSLIGSSQSSSIGSIQSSSGGTAKPTVKASSAGSRQSSRLGSNLLSLLGSRQSLSAGLSQSSPGGTRHSLAGVFLDPQIHSAAHQLAREMGLVQYYEAHGCVDPSLHLPAGANTMGLALACSAPQSQLLCEAVGQSVTRGQNSDPIVTNLWALPSINSLFEFCLSQSTIRRLLTGAMQADSVATNPAMTMMMTSAVVGEGDPALRTMVMMRALTGSGTAISGAGGNKNASAAGAATVPRAASAPVGHLDQGAQQTGDLISRCKDVMLMLMMRTEVTLLDAISDIRRQLMSYQCQEMTAGSGVTFRMCCPGHVPSPTYVDLAVTSMV